MLAWGTIRLSITRQNGALNRERDEVRLLAYVTGAVNHELLLRNEYLVAENRILRAKLPSRLRLSDPERVTLAEIGKRLERRVLRDIACVAKPDTILAWYRKLVVEVRWLEAPPVPRPALRAPGRGSAGRAHGEREHGLGI
jgi:hypothetical protein